MAEWLVFEDPKLPNAQPLTTIAGAADHATAVLLAQLKTRRRDLHVQSALSHQAERHDLAGRRAVSSADVMGRNHNHKGKQRGTDGNKAYGLCAGEDCYATTRKGKDGTIPDYCPTCQKTRQLP